MIGPFEFGILCLTDVWTILNRPLLTKRPLLTETSPGAGHEDTVHLVLPNSVHLVLFYRSRHRQLPVTPINPAGYRLVYHRLLARRTLFGTDQH